MPTSQPVTLIRRVAPYAISVLSVGVVALVLNQFEWLFVRGAFAMLLGCVFLSTWFGGWRSGMVATVLSAGLAAYLADPPGSIGVSKPEDWIRLAIFLSVASMIAGLHASRSRAVEAAKVSEDRLTAALGAARMGAWDKDLKTNSFWWSEGVEELFGRRPGAFVPTYDDFLGYIHPDDRAFVSNAFTRSQEHGTEFEIEHRIVRPDRSVRWIVTRGRIVYDPAGNPARLLGVAVDVTDRHGNTELPAEPDLEPVTARRGRL